MTGIKKEYGIKSRGNKGKNQEKYGLKAREN